MNKKDEKALYKELNNIFNYAENIYKLSSLVKKYCDTNPDSDDLYEVSSVIEIINQRLTNLSVELYRIIHKNDEFIPIKNAHSKIIGFINNNTIIPS